MPGSQFECTRRTWLVWARQRQSSCCAGSAVPLWLRTPPVEEPGAQVRTRVQAGVRITAIATYLWDGNFGEES